MKIEVYEINIEGDKVKVLEADGLVAKIQSLQKQIDTLKKSCKT